MALTRANVESILVSRVGAYLSAAGMAVTVIGSNASLNDSIGYAIRMSGGSVTNYVTVADADLLTVLPADYDKLLDIAELRTIYTIYTNLDDVDIVVGPRSEKLNQLAQNLLAYLKLKADLVEKEYGLGISIGTGAIVLDFADHNEALPGES